ncbi:MAG: replication-associated recombination protein A [Clostridiales bacterium]|nr:replication-associated recombination protein A [Clostridiales bacterium]
MLDDMMNFTEDGRKFAPLADRMRPSTLEEFIGQEHLIYKDSFLVRAIRSSMLGSVIFYGPPGTGKTTLSKIIASVSNGNFRRLNAVSSGVADAKKIIDEAKQNQQLYGKRTYLLLDECHRWSRAQSDSVLEAMEMGYITLIGSTTENPYIAMTSAIVSRCRVFEFKPLTYQDIIKGLNRAIIDKERGYGDLKIDIAPDAIEYIAKESVGDLRSAYNTLELAVNSTPTTKDGVTVIDKDVARNCIQKGSISLSENESYDMLSAFCKSLRGSDADAALFYAQKLVKSGYDPRILARRLVAHASEDVGMADSNAVLLAMTALQSCEKLGMPECMLTLSHAIIYVCEAEKSNSVYLAMEMAGADAEEYKNAKVPNHLKNHPSGYKDGTGKYKYPHDYGGYVKQQYLPTELKDRIYYVPKENGREKAIKRKKLDNK